MLQSRDHFFLEMTEHRKKKTQADCEKWLQICLYDFKYQLDNETARPQT